MNIAERFTLMFIYAGELGVNSDTSILLLMRSANCRAYALTRFCPKVS